MIRECTRKIRLQGRSSPVCRVWLASSNRSTIPVVAAPSDSTAVRTGVDLGDEVPDCAPIRLDCGGVFRRKPGRVIDHASRGRRKRLVVDGDRIVDCLFVGLVTFLVVGIDVRLRRIGVGIWVLDAFDAETAGEPGGSAKRYQLPPRLLHTVPSRRKRLKCGIRDSRG